MASENIFVRAKAYQKLHPRTPWADCIQKCKGKKVSGTKLKAVVAAKPKKKAKPRVTVVNVTGTRKRRKAAPVAVASTRKGTVISRSQKLINEIDRLEAKRSAERGKEMKDIIQLVINKKHDQLDAIKATLKKRA